MLYAVLFLYTQEQVTGEYDPSKPYYVHTPLRSYDTFGEALVAYSEATSEEAEIIEGETVEEFHQNLREVLNKYNINS